MVSVQDDKAGLTDIRLTDYARLVAEQREEIERLRSGLEWIVENIDRQKAPLIVGRAKAALHV